MLDDRKKKILQAIIDGYITTAEPVGSRTIAKQYSIGLSSATIRNEMADLEDMGYLEQPHTSAGRIPSDKGYRFYVDELMEKHSLSAAEIERLKKDIQPRISEVNQVIRQALVSLCKVTKYTSVATAPLINKSTIQKVRLVFVDRLKMLVVLITDSGIVKSSITKVGEELYPEYIEKCVNILNDRLHGLSIEQITDNTVNEIQMLMNECRYNITPVIEAVLDCVNYIDKNEVYLEGTTNMLNYPEYYDIDKARRILGVLDTKELLNKIVNSAATDAEISAVIGGENCVDEIKDCSLITATYNIGVEPLGRIGVIGPMRMDYSNVFSYMELVMKLINREINRIVYEKIDYD